MGGEKHGAAFAGQIPGYLPSLAARVRIDTGCRLVEEQELWTAHERQTEVQPASQATRQRPYSGACFSPSPTSSTTVSGSRGWG